MNITPLHAGNPGHMTGSGNWTYLLPGAAPVLIDAGVGHAAHLDALAGHAPTGPADVLVTHVHPDHASGAPALAARWPAARFAKWPWPERDRAIEVRWLPLADGQRVETGSGPLEVIHTPGHSPDHVALWHADSGAVFTGDLLVLGSTVVIPASHGGSLAAYLASLARIDALGPIRAWPAHGPPIDDPRTLIAHYLAHRGRREQQVVDALAGGPVSIAEIAGCIYAGLEPALVPQAHESVLAHLVKLEEDGRATRDGNLWKLR